MTHENFHKAIDELVKAGDFWKASVDDQAIKSIRDPVSKTKVVDARIMLARHDGCKHMAEQAITIVRKYFG